MVGEEEYQVPGQIVVTVKAGWDEFDVRLDLVDIDGTEDNQFCRFTAEEADGTYEVTLPMAAVQYSTWNVTKNRR